MALIRCEFKSQVLDLHTSMDVILPEPLPEAPDTRREYPVLFLLHGLSDDHTIWGRRTSVERYVQVLPLAVVMPAVHRSFYTDMAEGGRYWTFISEEVPRVARHFFPLSGAREHTFVAGLSMGGYGAFKLALTHPEQYAAAASLSGALDVATEVQTHADDPAWTAELRRIFGPLEALPGGRNDLRYLANELVKSGAPRPMLYQCCGTEDFLYTQNTRFRAHAASIGLEVLYEEGPGEHVWAYWDQQIQHVLDWLPLY